MIDGKLLNSEVDKLENEVAELSKMLIREQRKSQEAISTLQYVIGLVSEKLSLEGFTDVQGFIDTFNQSIDKEESDTKE